MIARFLAERDADSIILDFDLFLAEQAKAYRVSQPAIIAALRPRMTAGFSTTSLPSIYGREEPETAETSTTPPQPENVSSKVPAAQTDGEVVPPPSASPSVDLSGLAAHERGPEEKASPVEVETGPADEPVVTSPAESEAVVISAPDTDKTVGATAPAAPVQKRYRRQDLVRKAHADHPEWPDVKIAKHLGVTDGYVRRTASRLGLSLPSRREAITKLLSSSAAKSPAAEAPAVAPQAPPRPQQPPADTPEQRFRVKDDQGRYVHKRLMPTHTGIGVRMTDQAEIAWSPTEAQFAEAARRYPGLKAMRWEAVDA